MKQSFVLKFYTKKATADRAMAFYNLVLIFALF